MQGEEHEQIGATGMHPGPVILGHQIRSDERQCAWLVDLTLVRCSRLEYQALDLFFRQANGLVTYRELSRLYESGQKPGKRQMRKMKTKLRHLISGLRPKLWACELDVASVVGIGYLVLQSDLSLEGEDS